MLAIGLWPGVTGRVGGAGTPLALLNQPPTGSQQGKVPGSARASFIDEAPLPRPSPQVHMWREVRLQLRLIYPLARVRHSALAEFSTRYTPPFG